MNETIRALAKKCGAVLHDESQRLVFDYEKFQDFATTLIASQSVGPAFGYFDRSRDCYVSQCQADKFYDAEEQRQLLTPLYDEPVPVQPVRPDGLSVHIEGCIFDGKNPDGSDAFEYRSRPDGLVELASICMVDWHCQGPRKE